ncbi:MAG: DUF4253 domain-containing protein [Alphaproteobacteria bacterium]|nr:DUF4253 domain-containing protein [Alphaproteobacteria bacterium]
MANANPPETSGHDARYAEIKASILRSFPFEIIRVPGATALSTWETLKRRPGIHPIVIGSEDDLFRIAEQQQSPRREKSDDILAAAAKYHFPQDLRAGKARLQAMIETDRKSDPRFAEAYEAMLRQFPGSADDFPARGPWPTETPSDAGLSVAQTATLENEQLITRPSTEVCIALLPIKDWTEAFALLNYGGWNDCPAPEAHIAAFRHWRGRYQLELVGMSGDVLNLRAASKPKSREEALALATEHYEFCPDTVDQGVDTLETLAACLMEHDWWYFWWD